MAYLFYAALPDSALSIYKVYGFDPDTGVWTYILSPGPAQVSGNGLESCLQRLIDGKTYLALSSDGLSNEPARIKKHDGSWGEITVNSPDIGGTSTYVKAMRALSATSVLFMPFSRYDDGPNNGLFKWNGSSVSKLATMTDNSGNPCEARRVFGMAGDTENAIYVCGYVFNNTRGLWKWNGSTFSNGGAPSDLNGGYCGVGVYGSDIYALRYVEGDFPSESQCYKLFKGTWSGSWSMIKDFRLTYPAAVEPELNAISIDKSNGHVWVLLKDGSNNPIVSRYDGATWTHWNLNSLLGSGLPVNPKGIAAMRGKCMVTASMSTGVSRRTCYFDGSSWSLKEMTDAAAGDIPIPVTADEFTGYTPCPIVGTTSLLQDPFDTGTVMRSHPGNGTITYPGIYARLTAPNNANCQFYVGDTGGKPPTLYERLSSLQAEDQPPQPVVFETRLGTFSGTTNLRIAGLALFTTPEYDSQVPWYSYQFGWYKNDGKLHVWYDYPTTETEIFTAVTVADPATTPHRYRIYYNPYDQPLYLSDVGVTLLKDQLCFAYSLTECSTWVSIGVRTRDFDFTNAYVGIYVRKWETTAVNAVADFDYFSARQYLSTSQRLIPSYDDRSQDKVGLEDAGNLLNQSSGLARFDSPDGIKDGVDVRDGDPRTAFEDAYLFPQVAGRDARFDYPTVKDDYPLPVDRVGIEESLFVQLDNTDYIKGKYDADGKEYLGNYNARHILYYDATLDPWHAHGAGFYGAGRDGKLYYNGVECGPGTFGTLAGGINRTGWAAKDGYLDFGWAATPTISADGEMTCTVTPSVNALGLTTNLRWFLTGDFDIQFEYQIISTGAGPTDNGIVLMASMDWNNEFYVRRKMWNTNLYDKDVKNNGSWSSYASAATADTSGKLRLVRVGSVVSSYYWSGSAWVQIGSNYTMTYARPVFIQAYFQQSGGTAITATVKIRNFTINSGATTNLIGWAREAAGTYRGSQAEFPQHALIVSSGNSLDIIDVDTNRLWMSFRGGTNNVIGGDANYYVNHAAMKDGVLLLSYRTVDSGALTGNGIWIDFTLDFIRLHRGQATADAGYIYNVELTTSVWPRDSANGCIAFRNSARAYYSSHYDNWQYQNPRANWSDFLHDSGFQYRLIANNGGVYLCKWQRWKFEGTGNAHLNTPYYGIGTQTVATRWATFRPTSKDILAHDRIKLWITLYATWDATLGGGGGTWLEDYEYTLAGTVDDWVLGALAQDAMALDDAAGLLFYARNEGVYVLDLATGTSTLFYGKAGSGATHEALPDYGLISSVKLATDGATSLLLVGMARPDRIWAVNRATHTIYWRGFQDDAHQPLSMAVGV